MQSAPNAQDKIKVVDVVVSTNHMIFVNNRFPRLISLPMSANFLSGTSGITDILRYRSVNPIYIYFFVIYSPPATVDLGAMPMKEYFAFPIALVLLEPHHQIF